MNFDHPTDEEVARYFHDRVQEGFTLGEALARTAFVFNLKFTAVENIVGVIV